MGYPDWQRYANWVGSPLAGPSALNILPATTTFGFFPVSQWESMLFTIANGNWPLKMVIDSTPLNETTFVQQTFYLPALLQTQFVIPNRSDRLKVILSSALATVGNPDAIHFSVHPCNLPEGVHSTTNPGGILNATLNQNVNAGGNFQITLPFYFGPANIVVGQVAQATRVFLTPEDDNNAALSQVVFPIAANGTLNTILYLSGVQNKIAIVNDGAVAESVSALITAIQP